MSIIYTVISKLTDVLAEFSPGEYSGNFIGITQQLLLKIPTGDHKKSYTGNRYTDNNYFFHYMVSDELTYLCMTTKEYPRTLSFLYLEEIKKAFLQSYGLRAKTLRAYMANRDFKHKIKALRDKYNSHEQNKIAKIQGQVEEVKNVMQENFEKLVNRGEMLDLLVDKSESLNENAVFFL